MECKSYDLSVQVVKMMYLIYLKTVVVEEDVRMVALLVSR